MNYERFTNVKEQKQLHCKPIGQKDTKKGSEEIQGVLIAGDPIQLSVSLFMLTKADRFLSSGLSWDRAQLGPWGGRNGHFRMGSQPASYHLCLTKADRSLNSFAMLKENVCFS